jgi:hypothetical protein
MADNSHPLLQPRVIVAVALVGLCAAGWGLMATNLVWLGFTLSVVSALAAVWLYSGDFRRIRETISARGATSRAARKELFIALGIIIVGLTVPIWLLIQYNQVSNISSQFPNDSSQWYLPALLVLAALLGFSFGVKERSRASSVADAEAIARQMPEFNTDHIPLSKGLYIGEIRMFFGNLREHRRAEISVRIFNGTGQTIAFSRLSGNLTFRASNSRDQGSHGSLPPPSLRSDISTLVHPLEEWFIVLSQSADAPEADKILSIIENGRILFNLENMIIEVYGEDDPQIKDRVPLWHEFSYDKQYGFMRAITGRMDAREG